MTATLEAKPVAQKSTAFLIRSASRGRRIAVEKHFESKMKDFLDLWNQELADILIAGGVLDAAQRQAVTLKSRPLSDEEFQRAMEEALTQLLAVSFDTILDSDLRATLNRIWLTHLLMAYELGATIAADHLGVTTKAADAFVFELTDASVIAALEGRAIKYGRGLIANTISEARTAIRDGFFLGTKTLDEVADTIRAGNGITATRARMIARTETQAAYGTAMFDMFHRSGVSRKRWLTVGDDRVRPTHVDNADAGWLGMADAFPSGQRHPGDGVDSINCRCSLEADLDDPHLILRPWDGSGFAPLPSIPIGD